ncbi:MAG: DUF354 domain-containing protein [Candidatus Helarchaeota archaeon]
MDSCTTKQSRIACSLTIEFDKRGHDYFITARDIDYNYSYLRDVFKIDFYPVGKLGYTLEEKLLNYAIRVKELTHIILEKEGKPDLFISQASPGGTRVAFGLKIPTSIPKEKALKWGVDPKNLYTYDGVDELAWTKNAKFDPEELKKLGLSTEDHFAVFRPDEARSSYFMDNPDLDPNLPINALIVKRVIEEYPDMKIVVFPRYEEQARYFIDNWGDKIIIPKKAIDSISLMKYADVVVSGGGTMTREAALVGTPAVNCVQLGLLDPDRFLQQYGLPIFYERNIPKAAELTIKILKDVDKYRIQDTSKILEKMESLNDIILKIIDEKF